MGKMDHSPAKFRVHFSGNLSQYGFQSYPNFVADIHIFDPPNTQNESHQTGNSFIPTSLEWSMDLSIFVAGLCMIAILLVHAVHEKSLNKYRTHTRTYPNIFRAEYGGMISHGSSPISIVNILAPAPNIRHFFFLFLHIEYIRRRFVLSPPHKSRTILNETRAIARSDNQNSTSNF